MPESESDMDAVQQTWLAEITEGQELESKTNLVTGWFRRSVLDKVTRTT